MPEVKSATRQLLAPLSFGLVMLPVSSARAEEPPPNPARLDYDLAPNLSGCPKELFFHAYVAKRFGGQDPFTPTAPTRIKLTLRRGSSRSFVARLDVYDQAGARLGGERDPLVSTDCTKLVEHAGGLGGLGSSRCRGPPGSPSPQPEPAALAPRAPIAPPPALAPEAPPPAAQAAPPPVSKPGVFEGGAGVARGVLYGFSAAALATGTGLAVAARSKAEAVSQASDSLTQKAGSESCYQSAPANAGKCQQIASLSEQNDDYNRAAIGLFVAAGVAGAAATASIWTIRTPAVVVKPLRPGSLAGLTLQGSW